MHGWRWKRSQVLDFVLKITLPKERVDPVQRLETRNHCRALFTLILSTLKCMDSFTIGERSTTTK